MGWLLLATLIFPFLLYFSIKSGVIAPIPDKEQLTGIHNFEASEVYSADGMLLGRYYIQDRTVVDFEHISRHFIDALVATEDARFFEHHGIDFRSLFRVFFKTLLLGERSAGGGSTITQQLVKNIYPRQQYPFLSIIISKLREMMIASDLEDIYSKQEILTLYLNTVPFGGNIYGVEAASRLYFQKSAKEVNIQEAATLIGMLKATTYYNPKKHPDRALSRRNVVLGQMEKDGKLSEQERDSIAALPLKLNYKDPGIDSGPAPYFRERVRLTLNKILPEIADSLGHSYNLYTDGLKIYTTLDARLQYFAERAMNRHMRALQKSFDEHWKGRGKPWEKDRSLLQRALHQSGTWKNLKKRGVPEDSIMKLVNIKKEMDVYSWSGKKTVMMSTMDSIKFYLSLLNTGILSVNPATGQVKVWVGGINYRFFKYDHIKISSKRQVGSIFKPIVYAVAIEEGVKPCKYIEAEQQTYKEKDKEWTPGNADANYEDKYSLEGALTESVNTVSVKVLKKAGVERTVDLAHDMGIVSPIPEVPSIALGTPSISLFEMVQAYSVFVNKGKKVPLYFIDRIEDNEGKVIWKQPKVTPEPVLSAHTSQLMIEMLKNVVNEGTAIRIRNRYHLKNDIAGKTGTTQSNADGWFMAMTPHLVTGVWVGGEYPSIHFRTTALGQGANMALPIYALFQQQINNDKNYKRLARAQFPTPPPAVRRELDCDPFKEDVSFWEMLFGKKKEHEKEKVKKQYSKKPVPKKKEKGFLKGLKKLFKPVN